jgi:hypothetical protein
MRVARCVFTLACAASTVFAVRAQTGQAEQWADSGDSQIEWSAERKLSVADFKGRAPGHARFFSLSWLGIDAEWGCDRGALISSVTARFDPRRSWWRGVATGAWESANTRQRWLNASRSDVARSLDAQLLEHEQIHFDMAELGARKIRQFLENRKDACATPDGSSSIGPVVAQMNRELEDEQRRYDLETAHGTNPAKQAQWESRVKRAFR